MVSHMWKQGLDFKVRGVAPRPRARLTQTLYSSSSVENHQLLSPEELLIFDSLVFFPLFSGLDKAASPVARI